MVEIIGFDGVCLFFSIYYLEMFYIFLIGFRWIVKRDYYSDD